MPDTTLSTLAQIRTKVRRLTRSPSVSQLSDADIDTYVNTFVLYDFPEHLRQFSLRTTYTFYTQPFQDVYPTDRDSFAGVLTNPLYNFQNVFTTIHPPVYIAGRLSFFTQSPEQFFNIYPFINTIIDTNLRGDGITQVFTGTINPPGGLQPAGQNSLLQNNVTITSVDTNNNGLAMVDRPLVSLVYGNNLSDGNLYLAGSVPALPPTVLDVTNTINYVTGAFTVTFPSPPANLEPINVKVVPVQTSLPQALLYYDNTFTVRPVPNEAYPIQFEAYKRPTELLAANQTPELSEWWQYISYGASKKVFEDRNDYDSVQLIMPEFKQQERLVLRRTIVQQTNERVATIYTENVAGSYGPGWYSGGGNF